MSIRKYINYHKHDHISSIFTPDTPFKAEDFIKRAVELGDKVYFTTNHGSGGDIFEAKTLCDKYGLRCMFGIEGYIVPNPLEKDKRNYHIIIIPRTDEARKKVNYINSRANIEGYYYKPRIFVDDLLSLDKNDVYITTACVAGVLRDKDSFDNIFLPLAEHFQDHMFIEAQAHNVEVQKNHNKLCVEIAEKYGLKLIAATDSHYIYPEQSKERDLYLKGKGIFYEDEDAFILDYPDGDTLYDRFVEQGVLSESQIEEAMNNTFIFETCEDIKIDKEIKMPTIYPHLSSEEKVVELRKHIDEAFSVIKERENIPQEDIQTYEDRINEEMQVIEDTACINMPDYFLLNEKIVDLAVNKYGGVLTRTGRGCFTEEALVHTRDGLKSIKDVRVGDYVITKDGKFNRVINTMSYNIDEELVQIQHLYGTDKTHPAICTLDHKILILRDGSLTWEKAVNLTQSDYVCVPKMNPSVNQREYIDLNEYNKFGYEYDDEYIYEKRNNIGTQYQYSTSDVARKIGVSKYTVEQFAKGNVNTFKRNPNKLKELFEYIPFKTQQEYCSFLNNKKTRKIKRFIKNNYELNVLIGLLYGDGYTCDRRYGDGDAMGIGLAIHRDSDKDLYNRRIFENFASNVGLTVYENVSKTKKLTQLYIRSKVISSFVSTEFFVSKKGCEKKFNEKLFDQSKENLLGLIKGLRQSDGSLERHRISFDNTSNSLINAYKILCLMTGEGVNSLSFRKPYIRSGYSCSMSYKLRLNPNSNYAKKINERTLEDDSYYYLPIKDIIKIPKHQCTVYDITVENEPNYLLNNMTVHNSCGSFYLNKLLGMTQIDALTSPVPLYSSRFISTSRCLENKSMADIDYNVVSQKPFQDATKELLGEHGCYPMVAYGTMELSEAFRNTCRASDLPYAKYNEVAKSIETYINDEEWKPYIDEAKNFIGSIVSVSPHPCAHVLDNKDLRYEYGVVRIGDALCVMITSSEADEYKVLKDDFLIVSVWKLISETFDMIGKPIMTVKELEESLDDKVWKLFEDGITATLNQVDGSWATDLVKQYKIKSVGEAAMFTAALRPSFDSWRNKFINRQSYSTECDELDEVLKPTGSYILFQENLMQFFEWLGITPAESIGLIKKISKKKIKQEDFDSLEERLHQQWIVNVGNDNKFNDTWNMIQSCISYGFCSAHGLATGLDMLYGAYLKSHYPCEYYTVCLNTYKEKHSKVSMLISEMKYFNIKLLPPNINKSNQDFVVSDGNILYGLAGIVGVGNVFADEIINERNANGKFKDFNDFIDRMNPSKTQVIALVKSGAIPTKNKMRFLINYFKSQYEQREYKPVSTLPTRLKLITEWGIDVSEYMVDKKVDKPRVLDIYNDKRKRQFDEEQTIRYQKYINECTEKYLQTPELWEFETIQTFLSEQNPFEKAYTILEDFSDVEVGEKCVIVGVVSKVLKKKTKNGQQFAFMDVYSNNGVIEVVLWANTLQKFQDLVVKGQQVAVLGKKDGDDKMIADKLKPYDRWLSDVTKKLNKNKF